MRKIENSWRKLLRQQVIKLFHQFVMKISLSWQCDCFTSVPGYTRCAVTHCSASLGIVAYHAHLYDEYHIDTHIRSIISSFTGYNASCQHHKKHFTKVQPARRATIFRLTNGRRQLEAEKEGDHQQTLLDRTHRRLPAGSRCQHQREQSLTP